MATMYYAPFQGLDTSKMPSADAIEKILPDYKYIFYDPKRQDEEEDAQPSTSKQDDQTDHKGKGKQPRKGKPTEKVPNNGSNAAEDTDNSKQGEEYDNSDYEGDLQVLERTQVTLLDYQMRELENYRIAIHKMGKDILLMRDQIVDLNEENQTLRRQLNKHDEIRVQLLQDSVGDFENVDKGELIVRYLTLKQKVLSQSDEVQHAHETVRKLQAELRRHKEHSDKYKELNDAHMSQSRTLQQLQEKAAKTTRLEAACRQQEKVIEKMEKLIDGKLNDRDSVKKTLSQENKRLREQVDQLRDKGTSEIERLKLYEQIERAESRIITLEKTLSENTRLWAKEKSNLELQLTESEYGFGRSLRSPVMPPIRQSRQKFQPRNRFQTSPIPQPLRK